MTDQALVQNNPLQGDARYYYDSKTRSRHNLEFHYYPKDNSFHITAQSCYCTLHHSNVPNNVQVPNQGSSKVYCHYRSCGT